VSTKGFLDEVVRQQGRFFPDARTEIRERLPFYLKVRVVIDEYCFVEVRANFRSGGRSYVLVQSGKRIAGFDNLGGWHMHPVEVPGAHKRVRAPSLERAFEYFKSCV
jgi:hypothetical protein